MIKCTCLKQSEVLKCSDKYRCDKNKMFKPINTKPKKKSKPKQND